jgi:transcriptional regulator with XRE-family HTH domain
MTDGAGTRAANRRLVGARLRSLRLDGGLRQSDIAARIGRPQSFVSKYESGERSLDLIEIGAICDALGISLETFAASVKQGRP